MQARRHPLQNQFLTTSFGEQPHLEHQRMQIPPKPARKRMQSWRRRQPHTHTQRNGTSAWIYSHAPVVAGFLQEQGRQENVAEDAQKKRLVAQRRARCARRGAKPVQRTRVHEQAHRNISPEKNRVTSKSPVGDISAVTLIRTDTTLDHSQKAEKV